jgi:hypothetical protein
MLAYKLFRQLKNGQIAPLFINKRLRLEADLWYSAELHPTPGFAVRMGFHVTAKPFAPHLSMKGRVWKQVEIQDYTELNRPLAQGGKWFLANRMRIIPE